jgi:hypothetical protein
MALFDTSGGLGGLLGDFGFGVPRNAGGLIGDEERDAINKRALLSGGINAALTYLATPKNLNTGSALPYLGRAGLAGFGASQDVVDRALNTAYRNKILAGKDDNIRTYEKDRQKITEQFDPITKTWTVLGTSALDAPKERKTLTVDGVVLDAETMKPLYKAPQKPESLYKPEVSAEGKVFFIPQKPNMPILDDKGNKVDNANLSTKPPTGEQSNAYVYSNRMESADKILNKLDGKYDPFLISIKTSGTTSLIPGGQTLANKALSASDQRAEQAQRNFINAVLRRESGAVISPSEFENASLQYFPQAGDTSEVKIQKASNRRLAIDDLKRISGKSYNAQSQSSVVNFEDLK